MNTNTSSNGRRLSTESAPFLRRSNTTPARRTIGSASRLFNSMANTGKPQRRTSEIWGKSAYQSNTIRHLQSQLTQLNITIQKKDELLSYMEAKNEALRNELRESSDATRKYTASLEFIAGDNKRLTAENQSLTRNIQDLRTNVIEK
eukprot:UN28972